MMTEPIFYSGSGAYDFQYLDFATTKYQKDSAWIVAHIGIDVPIMARIARELKKSHERKFAERPRVDRGNFPELCNAALSVFCFTAEDINQFATDKATAFLDAFSLIPGKTNSNFQLPGQYNELQSHPFIRLSDGRYFLPIGFNLSEAIYEDPFYWMNKDKPYAAEALRHRGDFAQSVTAELLQSVFGESNVYTEVQIEKNKGHTVTDIDVLAIAGNKAVIAQVKSKRLTELAKLGDESKLIADFEAAVQDAYDQALLSRQAILDRTNKLLANGTELHLPEAIDEAYILCITLDHYPAVTHQVDVYLKKGSGDPFPVALSVFDLDVLAFYLKDPFEFLYYLRQRVAFNDHFKANSEMGPLGFHLKHKLFKEEDVSMQALDDSFAQLIDANFPVLRGSVPKTTAADKLYPKWKSEEFEQLVDQIKSTGIPGFTDAIFFLYDLAGKGADQLVTFLKSMKQKAASDGRSHDARLLYSELNTGITIVSEPRSPEALQPKLLPLAKMSKYRSKADVWLALGCMATSPRLVDAMGFSKEPWKEDLALRDLIAKLPFGGTIINHFGAKIGRNDQCPCGSGQKFKRCHGK
jgi:hypothetical protein